MGIEGIRQLWRVLQLPLLQSINPTWANHGKHRLHLLNVHTRSPWSCFLRIGCATHMVLFLLQWASLPFSIYRRSVKKYFKRAWSDWYLSDKKGCAGMYLQCGGKIKRDLLNVPFSTLLQFLWCGSTLSCPASNLHCCVNAWRMCVFRCEGWEKKNRKYMMWKWNRGFNLLSSFVISFQRNKCAH